MRVTEVARELKCSAAWLKVLERQGVIPPAPRDRNGHRRYSADDIDRLRLILFPRLDASRGECQ